MVIKPDTVIPDTFDVESVDSIRGYPKVSVRADLLIVGKSMGDRIERVDKGEIERRLIQAVNENVTLLACGGNGDRS